MCGRLVGRLNSGGVGVVCFDGFIFRVGFDRWIIELILIHYFYLAGSECGDQL